MLEMSLEHKDIFLRNKLKIRKMLMKELIYMRLVIVMQQYLLIRFTLVIRYINNDFCISATARMLNDS